MASPLAMMLAASHPRAPEIPQVAVSPTNIGAIYDQAYKDQMMKYQADRAQNNALWGGLASLGGTLGGAAIGGPFGGALGRNLFGGGAPQWTGPVGSNGWQNPDYR